MSTKDELGKLALRHMGSVETNRGAIACGYGLALAAYLRGIEDAEKKVRGLNDPMENSGYMYETAADVIASIRSELETPDK